MGDKNFDGLILDHGQRIARLEARLTPDKPNPAD
jgi:hypothetical protein